jgi:putative ABC transport system substrate-binding protein
VAWPLSASAQQGGTTLKVGILIGGPNDMEGQKRITAFRQGLEALGWIDGRNSQVQIFWASGDVELMRTYAATLIAMGPDALLVNSTPAVAAVRKQTNTIPIIFVSVSDPVGSGFVDSYGHPGGNVTGFASFEYSMAGKWLELLREIVPSLQHVGILFNPKRLQAVVNSTRDQCTLPGRRWVCGLSTRHFKHRRKSMQSSITSDGNGAEVWS